MGAHHYDIAHWALGMDDSGPVEIVPPEDPESNRGVQYRYASGVVIEHGGPGGCEFHGANGTLRINRGHLSSEPDEIVREPLGPKEVHLFRSSGHHRNWIDCIRSREKPVAHVEAGARSVAVIQLGNLAYWTRRALRWDPIAWRFENDADNVFLDRERRSPWALPEV